MPDVLTLTALRALVTFSDPQISADGRRVAYIRSAQDIAHNRNVPALVVAGVGGAWTTTLERTGEVSAPRWSPDGTELAYLRHVKDDPDQIVVITLRTAKKRTITHARNGVQHYAWSPDGRRIAYTAPDDPSNAAAAKHGNDLFDVGDDSFVDTAPPAPSHLWLVGRDGRGERRLTSGTWSIYEQIPPFAGGPADPSWSADGKTILDAIAPDAHDAVTDRSTVGAIDVATGRVSTPVPTDRYVYAPTFGPNGTYVYEAPHGPGPVSVVDAFVATLASGTGENRSAALDRDLQTVRWGPGGALYGVANDRAHAALYRIAPNGTSSVVDLGSLNPGAFTVSTGGTIAFVGSAFDRAPEVYALAPGAKPVALTHDNAALDRLTYGRIEHLEWTAPDGEVSDGLLIHPIGERPGQKYPLVVWMHGGPEAAVVDAWNVGIHEDFPDNTIALAAARGWYGFLPNYRGSDDRGTKHEHAIFGDPGEGPARDILAGLASIASRPEIDAARPCLYGHSYGGYMAAWLEGHDERWRCDVIADGAVDMIAAYDLSGTGNLAWIRDSMGGTPRDPKVAALYRSGSPITYASSVVTPTMLITGLRDDQVPWTESWQYYHALKDRGINVRLVGVPTAHHWPTDPVRTEAYARTVLDYIGGYLAP